MFGLPDVDVSRVVPTKFRDTVSFEVSVHSSRRTHLEDRLRRAVDHSTDWSLHGTLRASVSGGNAKER